MVLEIVEYNRRAVRAKIPYIVILPITIQMASVSLTYALTACGIDR
jgi:hypothetical protein